MGLSSANNNVNDVILKEMFIDSLTYINTQNIKDEDMLFVMFKEGFDQGHFAATLDASFKKLVDK